MLRLDLSGWRNGGGGGAKRGIREAVMEDVKSVGVRGENEGQWLQPPTNREG